ncbi:unnamed protein product [Albugo candida]|uniref:Uncharacterized protein n=1 Tax=Albugo candida TaxID=65357 RepID=A0A024G4C6_9STRA|nr:unnamed protein product [Albugo candida]|eukprot:CCI41516.1 unnamed protein product [Albugo candida]
MDEKRRNCTTSCNALDKARQKYFVKAYIQQSSCILRKCRILLPQKGDARIVSMLLLSCTCSFRSNACSLINPTSFQHRGIKRRRDFFRTTICLSQHVSDESTKLPC